jgi:phage terminase large subunit
LIALGRKPVIVPEHKIKDGINTAHLMFKRVWFNEAKCAPGLEALRQHRVDYHEKTRAFKKTAKEDWTSDAADAFRYVAVACREIVKAPKPSKKRLFIPME